MSSQAADLVTRFISLVGGPTPEEMADCWDEDNAVLEVPYAPPPWPLKIEGKENVVNYMGGVHTVLTGWSMGIDTLYDVGDGTIIVEMHGSGVVVATGKPYGQNYIAVMKVNDKNKLELWREYSNPLPVFEAFGDSETIDA